MPLEKCHFCVYGDGSSSSLELVVERCPHHAANWDPTIENEAERAAFEEARRPYEPPALTEVTDPTEAERLRGEILAGAHPDLAAPVDDEAPQTPRDRR